MSEANDTQNFHTIPNAQPDENGLFERTVLPIHGLVAYPEIIMPVPIAEGRPLNAARFAQSVRQTIIGVTMRENHRRNPLPTDLYLTGTEMVLGQIVNLPDGDYSALAEGRRRVEIVEIVQTDPCIIVRARELKDSADDPHQVSILQQMLMGMLQQTIDLNENLPEDIFDQAIMNDDPSWLADFVTSTLTIPLQERQRVLEIAALDKRLQFVITLMNRELTMLEIKEEINGQIQEEISRTQREMYLREQMRVIQSELGEEDILQQEIRDISTQIQQARLPLEIYEKATRELSRLQMTPSIAPEVGMIRSYLDWLLNIPWMTETEDNLDVHQAEAILNSQHYGLPKIKDRILEHIAVRKLAADKMQSPILCFVGPPGVGKTSLGKSIAIALGREFVRMSVGGLRDEAEIRGHRRTYLGALPGRILQTMRRAGTMNPVFMLDEIDKIGADFRGDPAAALLEVLDPEQNNAFTDLYMDVTYDLSKVMFITTANDLNPMPDALLDRMEIIEFPGYSEEEKYAIAEQFLIPKQLEAHGVGEIGLQFDAAAITTMIREYTYEAGVRNLDRSIAAICRKIARLLAENKRYPKRITHKRVSEYLGPAAFVKMRANTQDAIGVVTGLAWTSNGGDILTIEASRLPGKGKLLLTGQLGHTMQESAQAALSFMRSRADLLNVPHDDFSQYDVHIHIPEGAIPKDGPSAGIALAAAIISVFTQRKIRSSYAMTGEITLRGRVLPVGGIKEKILTAHRARISNVILPEQNRKDLVDIPANTLRHINIIFVESMEQVSDHVLMSPTEAEPVHDPQ